MEVVGSGLRGMRKGQRTRKGLPYDADDEEDGAEEMKAKDEVKEEEETSEAREVEEEKMRIEGEKL